MGCNCNNEQIHEQINLVYLDYITGSSKKTDGKTMFDKVNST